MQIQLTIDEALFTDIRRCLGMPRNQAPATAITLEALALFNWAAKRRWQGMVLVSANESGPRECVTTPQLDGCDKQ